MSEVAINLIPVRDGVDPREFARFSTAVDRPICLAQDVVEGFDAYLVTRRDPGAPSVDIVEVMTLRSWEEWEDVRDNLPQMSAVTEGFDKLVDAAAVRTIFAAPIGGE
jgi:hypothetical protein